MDLYCTEIYANCPYTDELKKWAGPNVPGISFEDAQNYCKYNGLGYCKVVGVLISEIPCKEGTYEPNIENRIDYDKIKLN